MSNTDPAKNPRLSKVNLPIYNNKIGEKINPVVTFKSTCRFIKYKHVLVMNIEINFQQQ